MSYTTEHDENVAKGIAYQRSHGVSDESIVLRIETIVAAAVLTHLKENPSERGLVLKNFHASLGPKVLDMPFSEVVNMCIYMATQPMTGTPITDVDGDLDD